MYADTVCEVNSWLWCFQACLWAIVPQRASQDLGRLDFASPKDLL